MSEAPGADTLELERELRDGLDGVQGGPWKFLSRIGYVLAPSAKGGDFHLGDRVGLDDDHVQVMRVRGWGYYTGGGHGALGLSPEVAADIQNRTGEHVARCHPDNILRLLDALASLRAEKEELRRERDEARGYAHEATKAITGLTPGGSEYFGKQLWKGGDYTADLPFCVERIRERMADRHQLMISEVQNKRLASALAEAGKALGLIEALDGLTLFNRDLGEDGDHAHQIGAAAAFSQAADMARSVATRIASLTKEPDNDPVGSDTYIDCMGDGRYPSGATCKSCRGSGHVIAGDGISPKVPR